MNVALVIVVYVALKFKRTQRTDYRRKINETEMAFD